MKKCILVFFILLNVATLHSQTESVAKVEAQGFNSQLMICFEKESFTGTVKNFYFNLGGPSLRIDDGIESIGLIVVPSLRMSLMEEAKPQFLPALGFGLQYGYKRLALSACQFYKAESGIWELTVGVGLRLK